MDVQRLLDIIGEATEAIAPFEGQNAKKYRASLSERLWRKPNRIANWLDRKQKPPAADECAQLAQVFAQARVNFPRLASATSIETQKVGTPDYLRDFLKAADHPAPESVLQAIDQERPSWPGWWKVQ